MIISSLSYLVLRFPAWIFLGLVGEAYYSPILFYTHHIARLYSDRWFLFLLGNYCNTLALKKNLKTLCSLGLKFGFSSILNGIQKLEYVQHLVGLMEVFPALWLIFPVSLIILLLETVHKN